MNEKEITARPHRLTTSTSTGSLPPNVEVTLQKKEDCPAPDKTIVIGRDPGI
jgi:hypothetical protein